ncbi:MAG: PKD domain-containing protein [Chlorobi bacterium]|nr:PKD domain-containing protein [Chlorobiota bacterium]
MLRNKDKIEQIFKEQLASFEKKPSNEVWKHIERKMYLKRFLKYKPFSLNIWNIIIITAISSSIIITSNNTTTTSEHNTISKNTNQIPDNLTKHEAAQNNTHIRKDDKTLNNTKTNKNFKTATTKISDNKKSEYNKRKNVITENSEVTDSIPKSNNEGKTTVKLAEPHSDFTVSTNSGCQPLAVSFTNISENGENYLWNFGNGKLSSEKNPTFTFNTAGTYNVTLTVTSGSMSDTKTITITVYPKPDADFRIAEKSETLFTGEPVKFSNNSTGFTKSTWNFGDNTISTYTNPSHIYEKEGIYNISLICINENNCSDTAFLSNLTIQDNKYKILFPTAFTPDKSGQNSGYWKNNPYPNTVFHPVINENISEYKLTIYNKYGAIVFESNDINLGWNGFYENSPAPSDVYVWECKGKFEDGKTFDKKGSLTLLYLRNR